MSDKETMSKKDMTLSDISHGTVKKIILTSRVFTIQIFVQVDIRRYSGVLFPFYVAQFFCGCSATTPFRVSKHCCLFFEK